MTTEKVLRRVLSGASDASLQSDGLHIIFQQPFHKPRLDREINIRGLPEDSIPNPKSHSFAEIVAVSAESEWRTAGLTLPCASPAHALLSPALAAVRHKHEPNYRRSPR